MQTVAFGAFTRKLKTTIIDHRRALRADVLMCARTLPLARHYECVKCKNGAFKPPHDAKRYTT